MDRLEKELKRIQQRTSEMIRNLTSCHRNTFDNSVSSYRIDQLFHQFTNLYPGMAVKLWPGLSQVDPIWPKWPNSTQNGILQAPLQLIFQPMKKPRSRPQTANTCLNRERTATPTLTKRSSSALNGSTKTEQTFELLRPRQCLLKLTLLTHLE